MLVPLYVAFIDYKQAFDPVQRTKLWKIFNGLGLCQATVDKIQKPMQGPTINRKSGQGHNRLVYD